MRFGKSDLKSNVHAVMVHPHPATQAIILSKVHGFQRWESSWGTFPCHDDWSAVMVQPHPATQAIILSKVHGCSAVRIFLGHFPLPWWLICCHGAAPPSPTHPGSSLITECWLLRVGWLPNPDALFQILFWLQCFDYMGIVICVLFLNNKVTCQNTRSIAGHFLRLNKKIRGA